jgi:hypothetical protein
MRKLPLFLLVAVMDALCLHAQTSYTVLGGTNCGPATTTVSCVILIPPANALGIYPNIQVSFNPLTGLGTIEFETFQLVENSPNGPNLGAGTISLAAPVFQTVTSNGQTSYQITDLTIYGYGSYVPASGIAPCPGPDAHGQLDPSRCWVIKPATLHFLYRSVFHQGGTYTWERSFRAGELTFSEIE